MDERDEEIAREGALLRLLGGPDSDLARLYQRDATTRAVVDACAAAHSTREAMLVRLVGLLAEQRDGYRGEYERLLREGPAPVVIVR